MRRVKTSGHRAFSRTVLGFGGLIGLLLIGSATPAAADVISGPTLFSALVNAPGNTYAVAGDLIINNGGSILCNDPASPATDGACDIKITVTGNLIIKAGGAIFAENRINGGNGGNIDITVAGDMTMCKPASSLPQCAGGGGAGAKISSSRTSGGGGKAGNITITVGTGSTGMFTLEGPGAQVVADAVVGSGGEISITAGLSMDIDGLVRSAGGIGGVSPQKRGGGPITLKS